MTDIVLNPEPVTDKKFYLSKTLILNAIVSIAAFYPPAQVFIAANPIACVMGITAANFILRFLTKGKVVIN